MKRKKLLPIVSLAALGLVFSGCGESGGFVPNWKAEEAQIFKNNFYDMTLPYIDVTEYEFEFEETYNEVYIKASDVKEGFLANYIYKFDKDTWHVEDVSSEAFNVPAEEGTAFIADYETVTSEGSRYVRVFMYTYNEFYDEDWEEYVQTPAKDGKLFRLTVTEPYYYDFPTDFIYDVLEFECYSWDYEGEYILPPAFEATYYMTDYIHSAVMGLVENGAGDDNGYTAILEANGFKVSNEKDEDGFYNALSPDEEYIVYYLYDLEEEAFILGFLDHEAPKTTVGYFSNSIVSSFITGYGEFNAFDAPTLDIEDANYLYFEDENNEDYYYDYDYEKMRVYVIITGENVSESVLDAFASEEFTWSVTKDLETGTYTFTLEEYRYTHTVEYTYNESDNSILVSVHMYSPYSPYETWPTEAVEEAVYDGCGQHTTDVLPAYEKEGVTFSINGFVITINCGEYDASDVKDEYVSMLKTNGFETDEYEYEFTSPNKQYLLRVEFGMGNVVELSISSIPTPIPTFDHFPLEEILEALAVNEGQFTDSFIGIDSADNYELVLISNPYDEDVDLAGYFDVYGHVNCEFDDMSDETVDEIAENYLNALKETYGYAYNEDYSYDLVSPNEQLAVTITVEHQDEHEGYCIIIVDFDNIIEGIV